MAIDSALKRKSAATVAQVYMPQGVTPDATKPQVWRQSSGFGYAGILAQIIQLTAFFVCPDNISFLLTRNKVRFTHQAVVDTNLSEFFVSPDSSGWLNNTVRFAHIEVEE